MLRTLGTILKWVILLPILAAALALAVANGQGVTVHLNPFNAGDPVLKFDLPLYQLAFILFAPRRSGWRTGRLDEPVGGGARARAAMRSLMKAAAERPIAQPRTSA